ncbi:MAG: glycerol kinase GlpK [Chloroflexi bacterium]|nr:glycerol kinase GlpK [Chloroflexota bacterium]
MSRPLILALDQGTSGSAAIVVDELGQIVALADEAIALAYPQPGWVEADGWDILRATSRAANQALHAAGVGWPDLAGIGITNQRETTILWDRASGQPAGPAVVWQCRRTADMCAELIRAGNEDSVRGKTGLPIDPYFSGTKIRWLLDHTRHGQARAEAGELLAGTVDSWLIWKLSGGSTHMTDFTNASRTMLFDIHTREWDADLLRMLNIPAAMLPRVRPSSGYFAETSGGVPILGVAGDQQAALFGQACLRPGQSKNTYGTGAFLLMNTGGEAVSSRHGLLTTLAIDGAGQPCYALEGAVFTAGAAVQWLRDALGLIATAAESETLARATPDSGGVYFVPAFAGLGSPYWDPAARGTIVGLTGGVRREHLVRATLEAIAFQSADLLSAMAADYGGSAAALRVDGGGSANDFLMQFQADIAGVPVERPKQQETTGLGAAYLAGLAAGVWKGSAEIERLPAIERRFEPAMHEARRQHLVGEWRRAVERAKGWAR